MLHVPCMFGLRFFGTWFNPFTQGASVSRSREGRWGVRHGNLKSWVLQCYSATSIWCVLYIMFIRVYHCLSWFDPTTTCTSRVNSPEMCLQKRRRFFFRCFQHVQVPQVQVIEVTKQLPKASEIDTKSESPNQKNRRLFEHFELIQLFESSHIEDCEGLFEIDRAVIIPGTFRRPVSVPFNSLTQGVCHVLPIRCQVSYQERLVQAESGIAVPPSEWFASIGHVPPFCIGWKDSSGRTDHRSRSATCGLTGQAISFFHYFAELRSYQFNSVCVSSHRWILNSVRLCAVLQMSEQSSFGSLSSFSMFSMVACAFHIPFAGVSCGSSTAADRWCDSWGASSWL